MMNEKTEHLSSEQQEKETNKELLQQYASAIRSMSTSYKTNIATTFLPKFNREKVGLYLQNPSKYEKQLRELSNYFYNINPEYKRIIWYIALMPTYAYILEPTNLHDGKFDAEKYKKSYFKQLQQIEKMNIRHEMENAAKVALRNDVFYGYEYESKDSYFIRHMDADYCRVSSKNEGVWSYAFDFSFYDGKQDTLLNEPEEFQKKYQQYKNTKEKWIELDVNKTVYLKVNEDISHVLPPFSGMFENIFDQDDYKKLKKNKAEIDNFLILAQKIPMEDKSSEMDKFLISPELVKLFDGGLRSGVHKGIGTITTPMSIEPIRLDQSKTHTDMVAEAQRELYNSAGVSQFMFNSEKNSSVGLSKSIVTDEQISFSLLRQIERWLNRKLNQIGGQYKHNIKFLDISRFNEIEKQKAYKEAAQSSMPTKMAYAASLGMSPLDFYNAAILENVVLDINSILVPLQSSHTQSGKDEAGSPTKSDNEVSDQTVVGRDSENTRDQH